MEKMEINKWCEFLKNSEGTDLSKKISTISNYLSWSDFSINYMQQDSKWLYNKLIGFERGENPIPVPPMTDEEMSKFKKGLLDLSEQIKKVAESL